ncbi:MAG: 4Fe-4S binding protein [Lachnospiraceae bacterium]|nr:4Fe-4S binding protein [Lachnospiraceae bacterium]
MDRKRKITQVLATLACNAHLKGLWTGELFRGRSKGLCVPGLNCYSCPAAVGSCPLGALQTSLTALRRGINTLTVGLIMLFGIVFGRIVCGWLCPFGLLQELLYMIPSPKRKWAFRFLRWLKYLILIVFVIAVPIATAFSRGIGIPAFCKYICPQGTVGGAALVWTSRNLTELIGLLYGWKVAVLIAVAVLSVFVFRPFCRVLCPLGAIYGLFNRIALLRIRLDTEKCTGCGSCETVCPVQLKPVQEHNSAECIRCGKCLTACGTDALRFLR